MTSSNGRNFELVVKKLVDELLERWPKQKKTAAEILNYVHDIADLVEEFGLARIQAAMKAARTHCHFLPEPAELRELMPGPEQFPQHRDPNCRECLGSGWKMVDVPADALHLKLHPQQTTMRVAQRCYCAPPVAPAAARKDPTSNSPSGSEVENAGS